MDDKDKKVSDEDLNKEIENMDMKEIEFDFHSSTFEIENDDSLLKFAKSRGKKKKD